MQGEDGAFVLASVRAVCRCWPSVEALTHAVQLIHTYMGNMSPTALTDLLEHGDSSLFFRVLQAVDESSNLLRYEKLRQYRLAMHLTPSKMTLKQGKLQAMKEVYKRYRGSIDASTIQSVAETPELPVLKWLHSCEPRMFKNFKKCEEQIFMSASQQGRANVVRWLVKLLPDTVRSLQYAASGGHLVLIKWLMKNAEWDRDSLGKAFYNAVNMGHLETAKFLYEHNPPISPSFRYLQPLVSLEMLQWLHEGKFWAFTNSVLHDAVMRGQLDMVQWLHTNYSQFFSPSAMNAAAEYGHLEIVKFLHFNRLEGCTQHAMNAAAKNDHLEIVKWLHENRSEGCTKYAMDAAAAEGHLDMLKWLHANRTEGCNPNAIEAAMRNDHLKTVKWLHEYRGLEFPNRFVNKTAQLGDLELLSWLHFNGKGMWSQETMDAAAGRGHLEIVKFLHKNRKEGCTKNAMIHAAENNHLDVVQWLRANKRKASTQMAMNAAARYGHFEVVKWLHENGQGGCTRAALSAAASRGHLKVVKFLGTNYSLDWSEQAIANAQSEGHTEVVKWLYHHLGMKLLKPFALNAVRSDNISLLEFLSQETDFCKNPTIYYSACGCKHPEAAQWYKDRYGSPRKRKLSD